MANWQTSWIIDKEQLGVAPSPKSTNPHHTNLAPFSHHFHSTVATLTALSEYSYVITTAL